MALPKISQPSFSLTIPSSGKTVRYRPFTVREEKILLVAQSGGEKQDYIDAFKQMVTNCVLDPIDVDTLASYDIEYIFLNLRAKSVSNVIELKMKDEHEKEISVSVNLDNVQVHKSTVSNKIVLDAEREIGIKMKYPTFAEIEKLSARDENGTELDAGLDLLTSLIELIWEGESVYPASESTQKELHEFISDFSADQIAKMQDFLNDLPYVYLDIEYTDSTGEKKSRRIAGISSFFG